MKEPPQVVTAIVGLGLIAVLGGVFLLGIVWRLSPSAVIWVLPLYVALAVAAIAFGIWRRLRKDKK